MSVVLVLVHSPLVGPFTWTRVAGTLRQRGVEALVPTLAIGGDEHGSPHWQRQARSVARAMDDLAPDRRAVLVGHSGAGVLLPAVRQEWGRPVAGYIFVDAHLPKDGQTRLGSGEFAQALRALYDRGGRFPNWTEDDLREVVPDPVTRQRLVAELRPRPWDFWEEPIPVFPSWPDAPCAYLRFGDNPAYGEPARQARESGWPLLRLDGDHFQMLVEPEAVADGLIDLTRAIGAIPG